MFYEFKFIEMLKFDYCNKWSYLKFDIDWKYQSFCTNNEKFEVKYLMYIFNFSSIRKLSTFYGRISRNEIIYLYNNQILIIDYILYI